MLPEKNQIEEEITRLKEQMQEVREMASRRMPDSNEQGVGEMLRYIVEEREKTNRMLSAMMERMRRLEQSLSQLPTVPNKPQATQLPVMALSEVDAQIIRFAQTRDMVCADDVKELMAYRGRNAACARLNRLCREGLLVRHQMGHKVYYRYDAGKATNTLIISPPQ